MHQVGNHATFAPACLPGWLPPIPLHCPRLRQVLLGLARRALAGGAGGAAGARPGLLLSCRLVVRLLQNIHKQRCLLLLVPCLFLPSAPAHLRLRVRLLPVAPTACTTTRPPGCAARCLKLAPPSLPRHLPRPACFMPFHSCHCPLTRARPLLALPLFSYCAAMRCFAQRPLPISCASQPGTAPSARKLRLCPMLCNLKMDQRRMPSSLHHTLSHLPPPLSAACTPQRTQAAA